MPSEQSLELAAMLRTLPAPDGVTIDEWRARAGTHDDPDAAGVVTEAVDANGVRSVWATLGSDAHGPDSAGPEADGPVMVWFHGGGFVVCSAETHRVSAAHAAARIGGSALVPDYRLAPEHPFPAAVHDGVAVMRWLVEVGVDPARTVIAGDSAGGNLALTVTLALRDAGEPLPAAIICVSPWTDLTLAGESLVTNLERDPFGHLDDMPRMRDLYLDGAEVRDPLASPLFADLAGLPPVLAMVGDTETMLDDSVRLVDALRGAGGVAELAVIEGAFHTWLQYSGRLPEAEVGLDTIARFLADKL